MPSRARALLLTLAWLGAAAAAVRPAVARAGEGPPGAVQVRLEIALGHGHEAVTPADPDGIAAGAGLAVRWGPAQAGGFLEATAGGRRGSLFLGLQAGPVIPLASWATLELAAEAGSHAIGYDSLYAGQPTHQVRVPFAGLRAGVVAMVRVDPHPLLLLARRAGFGLRLGLRSDLRTASLPVEGAPGTGLPVPPEQVPVGGRSRTLLLTTLLEW